MQKPGLVLHPLLQAQLPMLEGITALFHPHVESVLHDLESGTIAAVYNDLSKTKAGDRSAISKFIGDSINDFPDVFAPYYKTNWDGKRFKCVSITIRNGTGKPIGVACFNLDGSMFHDIATSLTQLLAIQTGNAENPIEHYTEDWQARINECIGNYLKESQTVLKTLTKEQKRAVVNRLYDHGLFNYRKAAAYISEQLHISRATVYNYLKEGE